MQILPQTDPLSEPYWKAAAERRLVIQQCATCGNLLHPPLPICPRCHADELTWTPMSGKGVVHARSVVHHATHPAMADRVPYLVALVTLAEGPRMVSNILNADVEEVSIGMPVRVTFEEIAPGVLLPQFEPDPGD